MAPKVVLVTGCSTGIGLYTALLLASDKEKRFKVYATLRNLLKKGELEEKGKDFLGDTLIIKAMDVCSDESVDGVVQDLLSTHQRIDILSKVSIFFQIILRSINGTQNKPFSADAWRKSWVRASTEGIKKF